MLAACGLAQVDVVRRPKVAVLSTGDELVAPGEPLKPAGVYDSNGAIIAAAVTEAGGEPLPSAPFPTTRPRWKRPCARRWPTATWWCSRAAPRKAPAISRTRSSRGWASPASWCMASRSSPASRFASASLGDKPIVVLPGFPDLGDLHLPRLRRAGDPRARRAAAGSRAKRSPRACRCASPPNSAARNSCWCRWSTATTARSRSRPAKAPAR